MLTAPDRRGHLVAPVRDFKALAAQCRPRFLREPFNSKQPINEGGAARKEIK